jgi:spore germination protein KB
VRKEHISGAQFFILIFMFIVSSSTLNVPNLIAPYAKQDSWVAAILAIPIALLLVPLYTEIHKRYPRHSFIQCLQIVFGKWIGGSIALMFTFYFLTLAAGLSRQVSDLIATLLLPDTPLVAIIIVFSTVVTIAVRSGIENLARTARVFVPWIMCFFVLLVLMLVPLIDWHNIMPVWENGFAPIARGTFTVLGVPYADLIIFLMITPHVHAVKEVRKFYFIGILIGGFVIVLIVLLSLLILGVGLTANSIYPVYTLAQKVNIGNFIQRLEVIIGVIWLITFFVKSSICLYSCVTSIAHTFAVRDPKILLGPLMLIFVPYGILMIPNAPYFFNYISEYWTPLVLIYGVLIPVMLLITDSIKKRRKERHHAKNEH